MEEQKTEVKTFTEKEVMEMVDRMQRDCNGRLQQMNGILNRLNFLLRIVEVKNNVFSPEFISKCASEIEAIMTIDEDTEDTKSAE